MRAPALPEGSVFMSSGFAWITRAAPSDRMEYLPGLDRSVGRGDGDFRHAVGTYREIAHIARVRTGGVIDSVLVCGGVEMRAGGGEVGPVALGDRVDMNGVVARRQIFYVQLDLHPHLGALAGGGQIAVPTLLPLRVFQLHGPGLGIERNARREHATRPKWAFS